MISIQLMNSRQIYKRQTYIRQKIQNPILQGVLLADPNGNLQNFKGKFKRKNQSNLHHNILIQN